MFAFGNCYIIDYISVFAPSSNVKTLFDNGLDMCPFERKSKSVHPAGNVVIDFKSSWPEWK